MKTVGRTVPNPRVAASVRIEAAASASEPYAEDTEVEELVVVAGVRTLRGSVPGTIALICEWRIS